MSPPLNSLTRAENAVTTRWPGALQPTRGYSAMNKPSSCSRGLIVGGTVFAWQLHTSSHVLHVTARALAAPPTARCHVNSCRANDEESRRTGSVRSLAQASVTQAWLGLRSCNPQTWSRLSLLSHPPEGFMETTQSPTSGKSSVEDGLFALGPVQQPPKEKQNSSAQPDSAPE